VIGTHTFDATGDASRRQAAALDALRVLREVRVVNVQFASGGHEAEGLDTLPVLVRDSTVVTGRSGPRKPIVSDIFDALATEARRRELPCFAFTNADIHVSQEAAEWLASTQDARMLSRQDFDGSSGLPLGMVLPGIDAFALSTTCWEAQRWRFRAYIAGEPTWDNVYASILMCHGAAAIGNRAPLIRHEAHPTVWGDRGPFADYTRLLAAQDAGYFSLWCRYWDRLEQLRASNAPEADERALAAEVFVWSPSFRQRAMQAARTIKAHARYHLRGRSTQRDADPGRAS
jgi:hypothetical protein